MVDSNKYVIKINHLEADDKLLNQKRPEMVTEWHVKRIVTAILILFSIIGEAIYFSNNQANYSSLETNKEKVDIQTITNKYVKETSSSVAINPPVIEKLVEESSSVDEQDAAVDEKSNVVVKETFDKNIIRSLLASRINNKEPAGILISPIKVNSSRAKTIYYYTEIKNMKGNTLSHHWLWEGEVIYKRSIKVLGDRWRAATSKLISANKKGAWHVRLVNRDGVILNEIMFEVID